MTITTTAVADDLIEYVRRYRHVTFVEVTRFLAQRGVPVEGDLAICGYRTADGQPDPNLILWAGVSQDVVNILDQALPALEYHSTDLLTYLCDGAALRFPIAKRPPRNGYVTPHWLPVALNVRDEG
jgi:hypothetical protein